MRSAWLAGALLLATACVSDVTVEATVDVVSPSTTTMAVESTAPKTAATSSTDEAVTTTPEPECSERDGLLRDRRGRVCPPWLWFEGLPESGVPVHLPGTYEIQFIDPAFEFARSAQFSAYGENPLKSVSLDGGDALPWVYAVSSQFVNDITALDLEGFDWVGGLEETSVEVLGYPATQIDFIVTQECEGFTGECRIPLFEELHITPSSWQEGDKVRLLVVDRPEGAVAFEVAAPAEEFEDYWTDTVLPLLDSVVFVDG